MQKWIERAVVLMHRFKIKQGEIAEKYGCAREHINRILNGAIDAPNSAEKRIMAAINEIITERNYEENEK